MTESIEINIMTLVTKRQKQVCIKLCITTYLFLGLKVQNNHKFNDQNYSKKKRVLLNLFF